MLRMRGCSNRQRMASKESTSHLLCYHHRRIHRDGCLCNGSDDEMVAARGELTTAGGCVYVPRVKYIRRSALTDSSAAAFFFGFFFAITKSLAALLNPKLGFICCQICYALSARTNNSQAHTYAPSHPCAFTQGFGDLNKFASLTLKATYALILVPRPVKKPT